MDGGAPNSAIHSGPANQALTCNSAPKIKQKAERKKTILSKMKIFYYHLSIAPSRL